MAASWLDFREIKVFEDDVSDALIMKTIIKRQKRESPFYIFDVADLVEKHKNWMRKMPRVTPHYAIKCNPDGTVIKILAALNCSFDCASEQEIIQVMRYGVSADRIIFANPAKGPSEITFAQEVSVEKMTVDCETELLKIKDLCPNAKVVIRIRCQSEESPPVTPGEKFGCDPSKEAIRLIGLAKELGLAVHGFSFHAGSPCDDATVYSRGIILCKELIAVAASMSCTEAKLIDIGGGFTGETGTDNKIGRIADIINEAIGDIDQSVSIISEPGQYYVTSSFSLAAYLHTKKVVSIRDQIIKMYYINCGVYNCFMDELLGIKSRQPEILFNMSASDEKHISTIWGATADAYDCIVKETLLPEFHVGDWLFWKDMGAYSLSLATTFNGITPPLVYPIIRRSQWQSLRADISFAQRTNIVDNAEYVETCEDVENHCPRWEF